MYKAAATDVPNPSSWCLLSVLMDAAPNTHQEMQVLHWRQAIPQYCISSLQRFVLLITAVLVETGKATTESAVLPASALPSLDLDEATIRQFYLSNVAGSHTEGNHT